MQHFNSRSDDTDLSEVVVDGRGLTPWEVAAVARENVPVRVSEQGRHQIKDGREGVEDILDNDVTAYGVNTGFGDLVNTHITDDEIEQLQLNLVRSHAAGTGDELKTEVVRAMLLARINTLAKGNAGVRYDVVDYLVTLLNEGVHPVVYSRGSLGASGDLAPLAHLSLVLIGEGEAVVDGERLPGDEALATVGLDPLTLAPKEGLALINGTQLTVGLAALTVVDAERLLHAADSAGALSTEVSMGTTTHCDPAIQAVRPHDGQRDSAANVRKLTEGSEVMAEHRDCDRVQDSYSIRCLPQVHGAVRDAIAHLRDAVETELNSATGNPLLFDADAIDNRANGTESTAILSGGNFHGEPLALRLDYATNAICELAAISERRTDRLLNPQLQEDHLPPFLATDPGSDSGLMIAQYTAASLLNEIRSLGRPSMDNTPVSGNQEDHVSMSAQSAYHARTAVEAARDVVAVELLCGSEAAEHVDAALASGTGVVRDAVREVFPPLDGDRELKSAITAAAELISSGQLAAQVDESLEEPLQR